MEADYVSAAFLFYRLGEETIMSTKEKAVILRQHHSRYREQDGRLLALEVIYDRGGRDVSQWVDVTDWSTRRLLQWLGY